MVTQHRNNFLLLLLPTVDAVTLRFGAEVVPDPAAHAAKVLEFYTTPTTAGTAAQLPGLSQAHASVLATRERLLCSVPKVFADSEDGVEEVFKGVKGFVVRNVLVKDGETYRKGCVGKGEVAAAIGPVKTFQEMAAAVSPTVTKPSDVFQQRFGKWYEQCVGGEGMGELLNGMRPSPS